MALEVAIHRRDGESAHGDETPIPADLALDGIDEVLCVMLAGPWWDSRISTKHPIDAVVSVESGAHRWLCNASATNVDVGRDLMIPAAATVAGGAEPVFLWLWGRADDEQVAVAGSRALAAEFRGRLAECTG
jgi:hypothetical protein